MLLLLPFASPPPIEPEDVTEAAGELLQNLLSFDWWLQSAGPSILRLAIIIALGVAFRSLLVRASNRLIARVANKQEAEAEGADSATMEIENLRRVQRTKTLGSLFNNIITIVVMGITVLLVLAEFGFNLGPLIAGAGIAGDGHGVEEDLGREAAADRVARQGEVQPRREQQQPVAPLRGVVPRAEEGAAPG